MTACLSAEIRLARHRGRGRGRARDRRARHRPGGGCDRRPRHRARRHRRHRRPARTGEGTALAWPLAGKTRGVLVKCAKPGQELRMDLPTHRPRHGHRRACRRPCRHRRRGGTLARPRPRRRDRSGRQARPVRGRPAAGGKIAMSAARPLKIGIVAGEESGDLLGADIVAALKAATGREVELVGARRASPAGARAEAAVRCRRHRADGFFRGVPRPAAADQAHRRDRAGHRRAGAGLPDHHRQSGFHAARREEGPRRQSVDIPIVHYICPSVWAWRPGRAAAMKPYVDHILCILPFEPAELAAPRRPAWHVRRPRLTGDPGVLAAAAAQARATRPFRRPRKDAAAAARLAQGRGQPADRAVRRDGRRSSGRAVTGCGSCCRPSRMSPTSLRRPCPAGSRNPRSSSDAAGKWQAFGEADAALIASGTVSLELALAGVPLVSCYKLDPFARAIAEIHHGLVGAAAQPHRRPAGRAGVLQRLRAAAEPRAPRSKRCSPTPSCAPGRRTALPKSRAAWRRSGLRARSRPEIV